MEKLEKHHLLFTRAEWQRTPIGKQVRRLGTFMLYVPHMPHRVVHYLLDPPRVPDHDTLYEMRGLASEGLVAVINRLDHPIAEHLDRRMSILTISSDGAEEIILEAQRRRQSGDSQGV